MGVQQKDPETTARLRAILDEEQDIHEWDNNRGNPVRLREVGGSYVQTIPGGVERLLELDPGTVPEIWVHPESNAITFVWD